MGTYFEDWVLCDCRDRRAEKRSEIHVTSARVETGRQFAPWQQPSRGLHSRIGLEGLTNIQLAEAKGDVADAKVCAVVYTCLRRVVPSCTTDDRDGDLAYHMLIEHVICVGAYLGH